MIPANTSEKPSSTPSQVSPSSPDSKGSASAGFAVVVGAVTVAAIVFFAFAARRGHLGLFLNKFVFRARAVFRKVFMFLRSL
jgi:predicted phage tail protein